MPAPSLETQFNDIFSRYIVENKRLVEDIVKDKGHDLGIQLYNETPKATKARIRADVNKISFGGFEKLAQKDPTSKFAKWWKDMKANKPEGVPWSSYIETVRAIVIKFRQDAIKYMASGWLRSIWILRGKGSAREPVVRDLKGNTRGQIEIEQKGAHHWKITLTNSTPGIEVQCTPEVVRRAINNVIYDMEKYLDAHARGQSGKTVGGR